ncbi:MAG TPA: HypC/HybG/HupF family hydrogenase formation chaperone [Candidatus Limnocylindrales bacterium]|nr:HypC/HybG/HupF family hydrogenase formation chaperone [Candidatus Limnocylindrales bacterium]
MDQSGNPPRRRVMCISYPGRVVALDDRGAVVETTGRQRRASTLLVPGVAIGDWVIVGAGSILRRLDATEAASITSILDAARHAEPTSNAQGGRP